MTHQVMPTYARLPVVFERGEGVWLWDAEGNRYFDAISGVAVCSLGHAHPAVAEAICQQSKRLLHTSNIYRIVLQEQLAERLCRLSGMQNVFFGNSGAEANEAAIKIARRYGHQRGIEKPVVVVMERSFHGRTLATLSASGNPKIQEGFEPLVDGFLRVPYNDLAAVAALDHPDIAAILVEPIQGEGGVRVPAADYLTGLRKITRDKGWLLMLDEVQTGMGRTGAWFGFQHSGITPDVMTLAKALGNGVPIGACLAHGVAADMLTAGKHASTFGGNPLACSAALAVLNTLESGDWMTKVSQMGQRLLSGFRQRLQHNPAVVDMRGQGLMLGLELNTPCASLVQEALNKAYLINVTADTTVRLLPPFILNEQEENSLMDDLSALINEYTAH